eukprot:CAMPEP_0169443518 /NCGR_PEP_ID=MMETSP1042-20121227/9398_1 /TAXON_ID=464988 /ORGANISM="Hemiselmis andersenii, Strain CCMP1180" /LENGTH=258 /DNA_ID=CAMNT_0009554751 /DNA_START=406 /DNA_END=1178 /DNA_ORIENTATION=+
MCEEGEEGGKRRGGVFDIKFSRNIRLVHAKGQGELEIFVISLLVKGCPDRSPIHSFMAESDDEEMVKESVDHLDEDLVLLKARRQGCGWELTCLCTATVMCCERHPLSPVRTKPSSFQFSRKGWPCNLRGSAHRDVTAAPGRHGGWPWRGGGFCRPGRVGLRVVAQTRCKVLGPEAARKEADPPLRWTPRALAGCTRLGARLRHGVHDPPRAREGAPADGGASVSRLPVDGRGIGQEEHSEREEKGLLAHFDSPVEIA